MKIIAFSDTHGYHKKLKIPTCDIVIFAGDFSSRGRLAEGIDFFDWFRCIPAKHKIIVPGNHDYNVDLPVWGCIKVLLNDVIEVTGYKILGSPYSLMYNNWNYMKSEEQLATMYNTFPTDVDILITHNPPYKILDSFENKHIGSKSLATYVKRVNPLLHIFGHNHQAGVVEDKFYNVSVLNQDYQLAYNYTEINI